VQIEIVHSWTSRCGPECLVSRLREGEGVREAGVRVRSVDLGRSSSSSPLSYDSIAREVIVVGSLGGMRETSENGKRSLPLPEAQLIRPCIIFRFRSRLNNSARACSLLAFALSRNRRMRDASRSAYSIRRDATEFFMRNERKRISVVEILIQRI